MCRGHAVNLCTPAEGKPRVFRSVPTAADIARAVLRSERLLEMKKLRASASVHSTPPGKGKGKGRKGDRRVSLVHDA